MGAAFVSLYTLFLLAFGVLPALYAIYLAFTKKGAFVGFDNFAKVFKDYRFWPAVEHVGIFLIVWLVMLVLFVVLLALLVHSIGIRWLSNSTRFIYYIPGALAGASSVMLWLFVLDPTVSPVAFLLKAFGFESLVSVVQVDRLPFVFGGDRVLDRCGRLDRGDVRRAQQYSEGSAGGREGRWRRTDPHRVVDPDPADAQVDRLHGDHELCRRHAAIRRAAGALAGEPRRRRAGLFAEPAGLPLCVQAIRLQTARRRSR
jgi:hypothetical protein